MNKFKNWLLYCVILEGKNTHYSEESPQHRNIGALGDGLHNLQEKAEVDFCPGALSTTPSRSESRTVLPGCHLAKQGEF